MLAILLEIKRLFIDYTDQARKERKQIMAAIDDLKAAVATQAAATSQLDNDVQVYINAVGNEKAAIAAAVAAQKAADEADLAAVTGQLAASTTALGSIHAALIAATPAPMA